MKEVVDYVPMANDSGLVADEKNLMKPSEAAKLSAKNARTMVKMMQLIEVMSRPGADNLDTDGKVRAKIGKLALCLPDDTRDRVAISTIVICAQRSIFESRTH